MVMLGLVCDAFQCFNVKRNPNTDQLTVTAKRVTKKKEEDFSSKLSFTVACSNSSLLLGSEKSPLIV